MYRIIISLLFLSLWCIPVHPANADTPQSIDGLVARIMPQHAGQLKFKLDAKSKQKYYRISASGKKILIEGDSPVSIAAGLRRYLKDYAQTSLSWTNRELTLPAELPLPKGKIEERSPYGFVTYMNYCTFGYTTTYWDWERWERELDWMALHGVTHPLAMVGVEQVWRNVLLKIGYTEAEAKQFLTGPAYLPWLMMGNMETLGGPMPDEWFERQTALQKKILARMHEYGMSPIFQAFYGMVPTTYKTKFPAAQVVDQGKWNTFTRPDILSPLDPEFGKLAKLWYDEYTALFGKADHYAGDLFHEGGKTGGLDVGQCARAVTGALLAFNPDAVWVVQSWGANPTPELLSGLDPKHAIVVELCAEYWHRWKDDGGYAGIPWAWSNISNWGGNIGLHGRLDAIATQPVAAQKDPKAAKTLAGIGFTPEGIETNPVVPELWADMVWARQAPDMQQWITRYPQYRYGSSLPSLQEAWKGFYKTAYGTYNTHRRPSEPVFCAKPSLNVRTVSSWSQSKIFYNPGEFADACAVFMKDAEQLKNNDNYRYDAVDMVRQYISDLGRSSYAVIQQAWKNRDKAAFERETARYLQLIADQDELLLSHPAFCLEPWLQTARDAGSTEGIKDQYEYYNRLLITSWDVVEGSLDDYTHRELGGLLGTYYYKRWEMFFNYLRQAWENPTMPKPHLFAVTETWWYKDISKEIKPSGNDPVETAKRMFLKYYQK